MAWRDGGKARPVLVLSYGSDNVDVYQITTQYANKSPAVRANYFEIIDWPQAGLDRRSYVDTGTLITLSARTFKGKLPIGRLTASDKARFADFLEAQ